MKKKKMVVGDGGGVAGIIQAFLLKHVDVSAVDIWAGTSVFAIEAAMYASKKWRDSSEVFDVFLKSLPFCFQRPFLGTCRPWKTKYTAEGINGELAKHLNFRFGDIQTPIFIPALNFARYQMPKVFDNVTTDDDIDIPTWEIVRMSSAAPSIFPPHNGYIDGGIWANNPVMVGAAGAVGKKLVSNYQELDVFSIPSGVENYNEVCVNNLVTWSRWKWLPALVNYWTTGNVLNNAYIAKQSGFNYYYRAHYPVKWPHWTLDSLEYISEMLEVTKDYVEQFKRDWDKFMSY